MRLLLLHSPRSLVLASDDYCLIFKQPPLSPVAPVNSTTPAVVVEFLATSEADLEQAISLNDRIFGTLGVLHIAGGESYRTPTVVTTTLTQFRPNRLETFLPIITSSTSLGSHSFSGIGAEPIDRILAVEFYCLTSNTYDAYPPSALEFEDNDFSSAASSLGRAALGGAEPLEHPCAGIRKILSASSFYYSSGEDAFDLSTRLEERVARAKQATPEVEGEEKEEEIEDRDARFLWNTFLVSPLLAFRTSLAPVTRKIFDQEGFVVRAIQGYCGVSDIMLGGKPAVLSLISRLGWENYGTRFNSRGIDDDGNVANFVEVSRRRLNASLCDADKFCRRKRFYELPTCAFRTFNSVVAFRYSGRKDRNRSARSSSHVQSKHPSPPFFAISNLSSRITPLSISSISSPPRIKKRFSPMRTSLISAPQRSSIRTFENGSRLLNSTFMRGVGSVGSRASSRSWLERSGVSRKDSALDYSRSMQGEKERSSWVSEEFSAQTARVRHPSLSTASC